MLYQEWAQLELSCIYLLNGYIANRRDPEILNEMSIVSLIPKDCSTEILLCYWNGVRVCHLGD